MEAASAHTRVINRLQQNETVRNIREDRLVHTEERVYADGMWAALLECFRDPGKSAADWAEV